MTESAIRNPQSEMTLALAQSRAAKILAWLTPHCERLEIAGSIRRSCPQVNDIDLVCIPKCTVYRDMFGVETGRQNHLWMFLRAYVDNYDLSGRSDPSGSAPKILQGSEYSATMKQMIVQLPRCQLDLWFADESTFAARLLSRTGSKEHNVWLAQRATDRGLHFKPYEGLTKPIAFSDRSLPLLCRTEAELYAHLDLKFIEPANRELPWLTKHIDSGL